MVAKRFSLAVACTYTLWAVAGYGVLSGAGGPVAGQTRLAVGIVPMGGSLYWGDLIIGLCALLACASEEGSLWMARGMALMLGVMAFVALLPKGMASGSWLGWISTEGIWLHAATALLAAYVGFAPMPKPRRMSGAGRAA